MTGALLVVVSMLAQSADEGDDARRQTGAPVVVSPAKEYRTIALMPLTSLGSTDEAAGAIQRVLQGELEKILGDKLIAPARLLEHGAHVKIAFGSCEGVVTCIVEVVGGLGFDAFVVGNIAGLGDDQVINLKLIDIRTGHEVRRTSEKAATDEAALVANMRKAAVELVAPELFTGFLEVIARQPGVQIMIDGKAVGMTPLANNKIELQAGRHAIEAGGEALVPFTSMVSIAYGETKQVTIELAQSSVFVGGRTPMRHRWWVWTIAGAGVLTTAVGGYFNYLHVQGVRRIEANARAGDLNATNGPVWFDEQQSQWKSATILYGVGGAFLFSAAVLLSFDLF
ncbi:MAG: PEGA domain-containing protein [Deltaproteobacteria bacterium]|nr:PEGA domain-containing protein [Deltaproteobacteria bacterium]